ncbi:TonB-dependent receptor domain-containing protein [Olleya aquimaris]|uniref:Outer membrane receptor protein involved in Fe transport n=1 Tax=Olleya aquimaris TaxID=639310 RepID=A0A327RKB8_9FLAO|nr:TonB-dependent receptor [Olleya aquimaris]RAJ16861.1 outer membrane receptor protein involved in Fe transport [Olleya aquimaris]
MKNVLLILSVSLINLTVLAQQGIKGKVVDDQSLPIPATVVTVYTLNKEKFVKADITEDNGTFNILNIKNGTYIIEITSLGFKTYLSESFKIENNIKDFNSIVMSTDTETLDEVVIEAEKPMVQVLADKTVFNVQNTISATGDSGFELLRKAPGVLIDNNDSIIVEGKAGVLVYIDDKPSVLRGEDLVNYLKTIQATDIDAIEIITQPSSKYDAEGNAGIINIKFKRDKSLGTNGSISSGITYGDFGRYNTSVSFNNRNKKTSIYGSFSNSFGDSFGFINLYRTQNNTIFDAKTESVYGNNSNNARIGFDYYVNKKSTFGVIVTGNFSNNDNVSNSRTPITPQDSQTPTEVLVAGSFTDIKSSNLYSNFNYRFKTEKDLSINIDVDFGKYGNDRTNLQPNQYFNGDETQLISETINYMITPIDINIFTTKVDFETSLLKGKIGVGVKYSKINTNNQFDFYNRINGQDILNEDRTNDFNYDERINAAYFNYNKSFEKLNVQLGMRIEQTLSDGILTSEQNTENDRVKRNYTNWFPSGGITYQINQKNSLALTYSKRIARPNYRSLNPFEYNIDELSFSKGNPFLQPQYTDNLKLSHTFNYRLNTSISYSFVKDFSAQVTEAVGEDKNFLTSRNVANQKVINLGISYPTKFNDWWSIYFSANAYKSIYEATNPDFISTEQNTLSVYAQNTFTLPKGFKAEVSGWYSSPSVWGGTYQTKSLGSLNLAIQKKFLDDKLTARLAFNDVLFTSPWRGDTQFGDLVILGNGGGDSRQIRFNLSYNFGRDDVKKARDRNTGLEDEKNRI